MTDPQDMDRATLEREVSRLRGMMEKDSIRTREHNILVEENRRLRGELTEHKDAMNDLSHAAKGLLAAYSTQREALENLVQRAKDERMDNAPEVIEADKALAGTEAPQGG